MGERPDHDRSLVQVTCAACGWTGPNVPTGPCVECHRMPDWPCPYPEGSGCFRTYGCPRCFYPVAMYADALEAVT